MQRLLPMLQTWLYWVRRGRARYNTAMVSSYRINNARIEWDGNGLPRSLDYGDVYFSKADPPGECEHVFLRGNDLPERFGTLKNEHFTIGELGFGSGLNFLSACKLWCETAPAGARLHYLACEAHPLAVEDMRRVHARLGQLEEYSKALLARYREFFAGTQQFELVIGRHRIRLTLLLGDARATLPAYCQGHPFRVDAWFLDGFAPSLNPHLWEEKLLCCIAAASHRHTTVATYSVAGSLRKQLEDAGFSWERAPGFAAKKHMLRGKAGAGRPAKRKADGGNRTVCVIGAGLAGCSTARALAQSGWNVILVERGDTPAAEASGNMQGILHYKPATADIPENRFNLHAFMHAVLHYQGLTLPPGTWSPCGMLQLAHDAKLQKRLDKLAGSDMYPERLVRCLDAGEAGALCGLPISRPALYFPDAGWLSPPELCSFYCAHPAIQLMTGVEVTQLDQGSSGWEVLMHSVYGEQFLFVSDVVLCNSTGVHFFPQTRHIPVIGNRGQVDVYAASGETSINIVLCAQGYIIPPLDGRQTIGGSFYIEGEDRERQQANSRWHLEQLADISPVLSDALRRQEPVEQRAGIRCTMEDRMPVVGQVDPERYPGLWINTAHGSNGIARTPVSAALLASLFNATPPPLDAELRALISPARYNT